MRSTATAQTEVSTAAVDTTESVLYTAIGLFAVDNNSNITVDNTVNATGKFSANALTDGIIINDVNAQAPNVPLMSTAVGVADVDNAANVNLNANVSANSIDIDAKNTVSDRQSVKNSIGKGLYNNKFVVASNPGKVEALFADIGKKLPNFDSVGMEGAFADLVNGKYFRAGASVGVYTENNTANVNVALIFR